jgi:hypothetical protein
MKLRSKVLHISFLELALKNDKLDTVTEADKDEEYEVEEILDFRISNGELEYLISWEGYLPSLTCGSSSESELPI